MWQFKHFDTHGCNYGAITSCTIQLHQPSFWLQAFFVVLYCIWCSIVFNTLLQTGLQMSCTMNCTRSLNILSTRCKMWNAHKTSEVHKIQLHKQSILLHSTISISELPYRPYVPCLSNESMLPKLALELRLREADVPMLGEGSSCSRKTNEQCNV